MKSPKKTSTKITAFDRVTCRAMSAEIIAALQGIADKYGVSIKPAGGRFTTDNWTNKIEVSIVDNSGTAVTKEVSNFNNYCHLFGLSKSDLGKAFSSNGKTFILCGLNPSAHKMPIIGRNAITGKMFKFPLTVVSRIVGDK